MSWHTTVGDTPESRSDYYRHQCGLPTTVQPGGRIIARAGELVAAVTMPVDLAVRVKAEMKARNLAWGPIIAHRRARRWTFLLAPDSTLRCGITLAAEMMRLNVTVVPVGGEIALPSPALRTVQRDWVVNPGSDHRPPAGQVLGIVRSCAQPPTRRQ
jgi:hypothetical protein